MCQSTFDFTNNNRHGIENGIVKDWLCFGSMRMADNVLVLDIVNAGSNFVKENQCFVP